MTDFSSQTQTLDQIRQIDEYKFEQLIADIWEKQGWETNVTTGSNDHGIDIIAEKSSPFNQKHLIQVKKYSSGNKVGSPDIQQYSSLRQQENDVDAVVIITTSSFTSQAQQTANNLNVKLINGEDLIKLVDQENAEGVIYRYIGNTKEKPNAERKNSTIESLKQASKEVNRGNDRIEDRSSSKSENSLLGRIKDYLGI